MIRNTSLRSTVIHHFEAGSISTNNWMRYAIQDNKAYLASKTTLFGEILMYANRINSLWRNYPQEFKSVTYFTVIYSFRLGEVCVMCLVQVGSSPRHILLVVMNGGYIRVSLTQPWFPAVLGHTGNQGHSSAAVKHTVNYVQQYVGVICEGGGRVWKDTPRHWHRNAHGDVLTNWKWPTEL